MKRLAFILLASIVIGGMTAPANTMAQATPGPEEGTDADATTTSNVIAFVENFVARMNSRDPSIVNVANESGLGFFLSDTYDQALENVESGLFVTIYLFETRNVLEYPNDRLSVDVTLSGYYNGYQATLQSERWYLLADEAGSYILDNYAFLDLHVPADMTSSTLNLEVGHEGLNLSDTNVNSAKVTLIKTVNLESNEWASTAIYILPDGVEPLEAQASIIEDYYNALQYIGKTPVEPGGSVTFGLFLRPGTTYLVQQFSLSPDGYDILGVPEGEQHMALFTVSED